MKKWTLLFSVIFSVAVFAEEPMVALKDFCEKNQSDYWIKNSEWTLQKKRFLQAS